MLKRKRNKNKIYLVVMVVFVAIFAVVAVMTRKNFDEDTSGVDFVEEQQQVVEDEEEDKNETNDEVVERKAVQYEGESPNGMEKLTGVINYTGINSDKLIIRTSIYQYLEDGTCELVIVKDDSVVYTEVAEIISEATTSTCMGFDVPVDNLPDGTMQLVIYLSASGKVGEIDGEVEL